MTGFTYRFNAEIDPLKRSVMRDLLRLAVTPDIISLATGLPAGEFLPLKAIQDCLNTVIERDGSRALQYGPPYEPLKEWLAAYMQSHGVNCTPEQIFITNGNQQSVSLLSRLFLEPGQPAVIESATFTGIQQATGGHSAEVRAVPTDLETGVDIAALQAAFAKSPAPRLAVLIPDFHNPLGVSISAEKRQQIAQLAAQYGVPIAEDDPYSPLRFKGEKLLPIKAYDEAGWVFYLGSFSKMLAPAMRLGWMVIPQALLSRLTVLRESFDLESSTLIQRAAHEFLQRGLLEPHLQRLNETNRVRCEALLGALDHQLGDVASWTEPEGGLFVWVTLPDKVDTWKLLEAAVERKVAFIPGGAFAVNGGHQNTMRLNFSSIPPEKIQEGIARLAAVIRQAL